MSKHAIDFAFQEVMTLAGGADKYSDSTKGIIFAECCRNKNLQTLAGMYLVGSSERAEKNLAKLRAEIYRVFLERA